MLSMLSQLHQQQDCSVQQRSLSISDLALETQAESASPVLGKRQEWLQCQASTCKQLKHGCKTLLWGNSRANKRTCAMFMHKIVHVHSFMCGNSIAKLHEMQAMAANINMSHAVATAKP